MLLMQEPEELFEVTAQCLMSGQDRDAISGWGAIIHVMWVQLNLWWSDSTAVVAHCIFMYKSFQRASWFELALQIQGQGYHKDTKGQNGLIEQSTSALMMLPYQALL